MILVIGGISSGKRDFVLENFDYKVDDFSENINDSTPVLYDLQNIENLDNIESLLKKDVIICNEIGCGIVPTDKKEREHRDFIGKLLIDIAKNATEVYRVYAGIGQKLK